ncbi:SufD family Fe-S cluster assembly protein [Alicyclobacillus sp. TC]|uniref:SufB/SufD family protein n=1 Tax=Alicyclobacillus sp. TC TaxID=2606450 RepID=UPI00193257A6|nr:SufD family Fe-S cluster assembly protein [Alicyclobacillus sp. TC]QRF24008.1 SufD family Fe-S cluster assembly protein [Alicyclobacillus sp. TC]
MTEKNVVSASVGRALSHQLQEADWLADWRESAWTSFQTLEKPWLEKTDLKRCQFEVVEKSPSTGSHLEARKLFEFVTGSAVLILGNRIEAIRLTEEDKKNGVVLMSLHEASHTHRHLLEKYLGSVVPSSHSKWAALNAAAFQAGVLLYVPRHVEVSSDILIIRSEEEALESAYPRTLVIADTGAKARVAEMQFAKPAATSAAATSDVWEVVAENDARLEIGLIEEILAGPYRFYTRRAKLGKDAEVNWYAASTGDGLAVSDIESLLDGNGSRSNTRVLGTAVGRMHHDLTAKMTHAGRYSESDIVMHGVLRQKANAVFRSCTEIIKGAVEAGSEQHDRMILVDSTARADAIPMLLIDENDVKRCGHAASVGKIDPNQIYYLMSRGISEKLATRMIIWGYFEETILSLPVEEAVREAFVARLEKELD